MSAALASPQLSRAQVIDPILFIKACWPDIQLYDKQKDILYSLRDNDQTNVKAGNMLGKDFIAGLAVIWFFVSRHPCRIVTTSVDETQLKTVLWGEIGGFLNSSVIGLTSDRGGSLIVNDLLIRKRVFGQICKKSYILGRVATDDGSGFLGHHIANTGDGIPRTMFLADEASAVRNMYFDKALTWANVMFAFGNPYDCNNWWRKQIKRGTVYSKDGKRCFNKVITIGAKDSPNVKLALAQIAKGLEPTGEVVIPGVKSWQEYAKNLEEWDIIKQTISLNAEFYDGAEVKMFPPERLDNSRLLARGLRVQQRKVKAIGCDTAEGGDDTVWTGVDELGLVFQRAQKTADTDIIPGITIALSREHGVIPEQIVFDQGGGGKEHVDRLRKTCRKCFEHETKCKCQKFVGFNVRSVAFGEAATDAERVFDPARGYRPKLDKVDERETKYVYANRRAQMYHETSLLVKDSWAIGSEYEELLRQLEPIPLKYDPEGRIWLPPKNKKDKNSKIETLVEILGCSPDEADSTVLAVYGMNNPKRIFVARAL